jgi:hypothetical protein
MYTRKHDVTLCNPIVQHRVFSVHSGYFIFILFLKSHNIITAKSTL